MNDKHIVQFTDQSQIKHSKETVTSFVKSMFISQENFLFGIFYHNLHIGNIKLGTIIFSSKGDISYIIGNKSFWEKESQQLLSRKLFFLLFTHFIFISYMRASMKIILVPLKFC